ncbi:MULTISPECIES: phosphotransferase [Bacillaceae]|uniref:phosphotransferase n=1 Tax=Bacillaceae TaxID=186817 RepID=UPI002FFF17C6
MKAANIKKARDDAYFDRLFSYFKSQFIDITKIKPLHGNVFLLKTTSKTYVIKGYQSNKKLKLQEAFTATLKKEGFSKTYQFLSPPMGEDLFFEGIYFGCIEYIPSNKTAFSFHTQKNRQDGLDIIEQFHQITEKCTSRYRTLLSEADLLGKWKERLQIFANNLPFLRYFISEPFISEWISWAQWSLNQFEKIPDSFANNPPVILHGDVAHHNFLRHRKGDLYLIDFDLVSIGPAEFDYLQYANRILPYLDWSLDKLFYYPQFKKHREDRSFMVALAYPADIFREWNRLIREKTYSDQIKLKQVIDLSVGQFYSRKKFFEKVLDQIE